MGLYVNGIDKKSVESLELVNLEGSKKLYQFDKSSNSDIPILSFGNSRKRDLGYIGYQNYYDYIDFSSTSSLSLFLNNTNLNI